VQGPRPARLSESLRVDTSRTGVRVRADQEPRTAGDAESELLRVNPSRSESIRVDPSRSESIRVDPSRSEPSGGSAAVRVDLDGGHVQHVHGRGLAGAVVLPGARAGGGDLRGSGEVSEGI
jgi:hypothetical protein